MEEQTLDNGLRRFQACEARRPRGELRDETALKTGTATGGPERDGPEGRNTASFLEKKGCPPCLKFLLKALS